MKYIFGRSHTRTHLLIIHRDEILHVVQSRSLRERENPVIPVSTVAHAICTNGINARMGKYIESFYALLLFARNFVLRCQFGGGIVHSKPGKLLGSRVSADGLFEFKCESIVAVEEEQNEKNYSLIPHQRALNELPV